MKLSKKGEIDFNQFLNKTRKEMLEAKTQSDFLKKKKRDLEVLDEKINVIKTLKDTVELDNQINNL